MNENCLNEKCFVIYFCCKPRRAEGAGEKKRGFLDYRIWENPDNIENIFSKLEVGKSFLTILKIVISIMGEGWISLKCDFFFNRDFSLIQGLFLRTLRSPCKGPYGALGGPEP